MTCSFDDYAIGDEVIIAVPFWMCNACEYGSNSIPSGKIYGTYIGHSVDSCTGLYSGTVSIQVKVVCENCGAVMKTFTESCGSIENDVVVEYILGQFNESRKEKIINV